MNIKKLLSVIAFVLFAFDIQGQTSHGAYGFLDATNSARVAALGNTDLSIYDNDMQLGIYNPSLINSEMHNDIALSYVNYYAGINFMTGQYSRTFDKIGSFVGTIQYHNYGKFKYADEQGNVDGSTFSPSDYNIMVGWGRQLTPHWSIGANVKMAGIQYEHFKTFAVAVDVAGSYRTESGWMFSATARNVGYELYSNFEGKRNKLPFRMSAGVSKRLEHVPFLFSIVYENIQKWDLSYDDPLDLESNYDPITGTMKKQSKAGKFGDNLMRHLVFGGEIYIGKNLVLRTGYNYGMRKNLQTPTRKGLCGFSYGVGVNIWHFSINYSRSEMHIYGSPNYITISTNLDKFVKNSK
ncbi:MAG: type IX secretion system protein PorQ [Bacteroidales bacterium]|nr:type IX secretion system protein PorQ [Bacteroidales bacterium]